jgi:GNAT superfamily N-acetyltransferase
MSEPRIRLATLEDSPLVAGVIRSLEVHYNGAQGAPPIGEIETMVADSMGCEEGTRYALALVGERAAGLACFAILRPGKRLSGLLFLKELFVEEDVRGRSVGAALLRWLATYARVRGIGRIDLTTEAGNRRARAFYERLGAERLDKVFYRFDLRTGPLARGALR